MTRNELINKTANTIISDVAICKNADRMETLLKEFVDEYNKNGYLDRYASEDWQRVLKNVAVKLNGTTYSDKVHTAQTHLAEARYWRNKV